MGYFESLVLVDIAVLLKTEDSLLVSGSTGVHLSHILEVDELFA